MARRATKIAQERSKGGLVLVLDAGDSLVGDIGPAVKTQGQTSVTAMNRMGYDAVALGPQDLALGPAVLKQRMSEAQFAVLSANAVLSPSGKLVAAPYIVRELGGHRVAIVGISGGRGTAEIAILDPLEAARTAVAEAARKADAVVLLSHAGSSVDRQIADTVPGIAAIVSGGSAQIQMPWQSSKARTVVVHSEDPSPGHTGRRLGATTLNLDGQGRVVDYSSVVVDLLPIIPDDPAMADWVKQVSQ